jgi:hypothetical protein
MQSILPITKKQNGLCQSVFGNSVGVPHQFTISR